MPIINNDRLTFEEFYYLCFSVREIETIITPGNYHIRYEFNHVVVPLFYFAGCVFSSPITAAKAAYNLYLR